jgi:hypothetical protein
LAKAAAEERDGWSAKASTYVTVITMFALSLFLLYQIITAPGSLA